MAGARAARPKALQLQGKESEGRRGGVGGEGGEGSGKQQRRGWGIVPPLPLPSPHPDGFPNREMIGTLY